MTQQKQQIILLVDDEELNLRVIAGYLGGLGPRLIGATTGLDAIEKASGIPPDLILMDVVMPDMDGIEACRRIKQSEGLKNIPVIFLSALDDTKSKVRAFEAGGVDFITKPITKEELVARVRTQLRMRAMQRRIEEQNRILRAESERLRKTEKLQRDTERRFKLMFANIKVMVAMLDPEGRFVQVNDYSEKLLGYSREELSSMTCEAFDVTEGVDRVQDKMAPLMSGESRYVECERRFKRKNGKQFWCNFTLSSILSTNGNCKGFVCFASDISARKASEEQLRKHASAVEQSQNTVMIADTEGRLEFVNPAFSHSTGYSPEEVIGTRARFLGVMNQDSKIYREMWDKISNGEVWRGEFSNRRRDGAQFWEAATVSPVKNEHGQITNYVAVKEDITGRKRAEEALKKAKETAEHAKRMAEDASKAKSDFLATMSHEIRTPMGGVLGMADLLLDSELSDRQRQQVQTIRKSGRTLIRVINDILDFSKIQAGKMALQSRSFDLSEVIGNLTDVFQDRMEEKGLKFYVDNPRETVPQLLQGDPERLSQILYNLVGNAEKFTEHGNVFVEVSVLEDHDDDVKLRFDVTDTGIGIAEEYREQIFEAFSQEDPSVNRKYGGTGLGLVIARRLALLMGGELSLSSVEGKGSNFWFTGNFGKQEFGSEEDDAAGTSEHAKASAMRFNARVLVVEDNLVNQQVAKGTLELMGCEVGIANNGQEALDELEKSSAEIDIVLMDCEMPVVDGYQAASRWRAHELEKQLPHMPIVALTAHVLDTFRKTALDAGMDDFVSKPFTRERLASALDKWIGSKEELDSRDERGQKVQQSSSPPETGETPVEESHLDLDTVEQLKQMDIVMLVELFAKQSPDLLQKIYKAVEKTDSEELRKAAHTLKSSSATIGAIRLSAMCKKLEDANRESFSLAGVSLEELEQEFMVSCQELLEIAENA